MKINASMLLERTRTGYVLTASIGNCCYMLEYGTAAEAEAQITKQLELTPRAKVTRR